VATMRTSWAPSCGVGGLVLRNVHRYRFRILGDFRSRVCRRSSRRRACGCCSGRWRKLDGSWCQQSWRSVAFSGGGAGDLIGQLSVGQEVDGWHLLFSGVGNVAGMGLGGMLAEPITPYMRSTLNSSGVASEIAKAITAGEVRSGIGGFFAELATSWGIDESGRKPCP